MIRRTILTRLSLLPGVAFGKKPAIIAAETIKSELPSILSTQYPDGQGPAPAPQTFP